LLFVGHNARFDARVSRAIGNQSLASDVMSQQEALELLRGVVAPHYAEQFGRGLQGSQIARDISGTAWHEAFTFELDHRHGSFRRNPGYVTPQELIQHHVAHDQNTIASR